MYYALKDYFKDIILNMCLKIVATTQQYYVLYLTYLRYSIFTYNNVIYNTSYQISCIEHLASNFALTIVTKQNQKKLILRLRYSVFALNLNINVNTIIIEQNLNQLRQKHLRDICALQTLAKSNIYRDNKLLSYNYREKNNN